MQDSLINVADERRALAHPQETESRCSRVCTNMMLVLIIIMLLVLGLGALWRAFYWLDTQSHPVATSQEYHPIGVAYFCTTIGILWFVKQFGIILMRRTS